MANIKDVARLAGVSVATVSRTLDGSPKVTAATRARVLEAVAACGYVTNALARNFRQRRTHTVLVLVPDIANPFFSRIIRGIERVALEHGYRILLGDTQYNAERERAYAALVTQRQADGIICLGMNIPFATGRSRSRLDPDWPPFVMACEYDGEIPAPTVCIDNVRAATEATRHLLDLGHRDIAFISGPRASPLCRDRLAGFTEAMTAAGLRVRRERVRYGDFSLAAGHQQMRALLGGARTPSAVFCANDEMAIGALRAARQAGLSLPRELSIVGFDDIAFAEFATPALTTIRQPREQIGVRSMHLMLEILRDGQQPGRRIVLAHELVVRESSVAAP